jgi:hypothetical protein
MGLLIGLLCVILFFKLFVGISVGLFKLLIGLFVVVALFTIAPIGLALVGLMIPVLVIAAFIGIIGFLLKVIF